MVPTLLDQHKPLCISDIRGSGSLQSLVAHAVEYVEVRRAI